MMVGTAHHALKSSLIFPSPLEGCTDREEGQGEG